MNEGEPGKQRIRLHIHRPPHESASPVLALLPKRRVFEAPLRRLAKPAPRSLIWHKLSLSEELGGLEAKDHIALFLGYISLTFPRSDILFFDVH